MQPPRLGIILLATALYIGLLVVVKLVVRSSIPPPAPTATACPAGTYFANDKGEWDWALWISTEAGGYFGVRPTDPEHPNRVTIQFTDNMEIVTEKED